MQTNICCRWDGVSKTLTDFLFALQDWVEKGCPRNNSHDFSRTDSICFQLGKFLEVGENEDIYLVELDRLFPGNRSSYRHPGRTPFNEERGSYSKELCDGDGMGHYSNEKRLTWLKEIVEYLKKQQTHHEGEDTYGNY